jgi:CheY-like chemotaxis protein
VLSASRVLVVDDDVTLRETLGEVLRDEGYEVRLASDGAAALAQLDGWPADLVVLDVMMPVMDAYSFRLMQLARDGEHSAPVVIISAAQNLDDAGRRLNAASVIAKPFRLSQLLDEVRRVLEAA